MNETLVSVFVVVATPMVAAGCYLGIEAAWGRLRGWHR